MTPCPLPCKFDCEYEKGESVPNVCPYGYGAPHYIQDEGQFTRVGDAKVICELPSGTSVKALNGALVACHPDHAPIFIGGKP